MYYYYVLESEFIAKAGWSFIRHKKKIKSNLVSIYVFFLEFFMIQTLVILIMWAKYPSSESAQIIIQMLDKFQTNC